MNTSKVRIAGNIIAQPQIFKTNNGNLFAMIKVACDPASKANRNPESSPIQVKVYDQKIVQKIQTQMDQSFTVGSKVSVTGKIVPNEYETESKKAHSFDIVADKINTHMQVLNRQGEIDLTGIVIKEPTVSSYVKNEKTGKVATMVLSVVYKSTQDPNDNSKYINETFLIQVPSFGYMADFVEKNVKKGDKISLNGNFINISKKLTAKDNPAKPYYYSTLKIIPEHINIDKKYQQEHTPQPQHTPKPEIGSYVIDKDSMFDRDAIFSAKPFNSVQPETQKPPKKYGR